MGKSQDKIKPKSSGKGMTLLIVTIAVIILLIVFIFFGTTIGDWVRGAKSAASDEPASTADSSYSLPAESTGESSGAVEPAENGYPENETQLSPSYQLDAPKKGDTVAVVTTSEGVMRFKLLADTAPKAVENFTAKAKAGYYNNTKFETLYEDQAVQSGGDNNTVFGTDFPVEYSVNLHNYYGALGLSNDGTNNTNQFYIVSAKKVADDILAAMSGEKAQATGFGFTPEVINAYATHGGDPTLDGGFGVFGQLYEGYDVLDTINAVGAAEGGAPAREIKIISVEIGTY